jgi:hypothetical protein
MSFEYLADPAAGPNCRRGVRRIRAFFRHMGQPTEHATAEQPPSIPDFPRMQEAATAHAMEFLPDFDWTDGQ